MDHNKHAHEKQRLGFHYQARIYCGHQTSNCGFHRWSLLTGPHCIPTVKNRRVCSRERTDPRLWPPELEPELELARPNFNGWLRLTQPPCLTPEPLTHESLQTGLLASPGKREAAKRASS